MFGSLWGNAERGWGPRICCLYRDQDTPAADAPHLMSSKPYNGIRQTGHPKQKAAKAKAKAKPKPAFPSPRSPRPKAGSPRKPGEGSPRKDVLEKKAASPRLDDVKSTARSSEEEEEDLETTTNQVLEGKDFMDQTVVESAEIEGMDMEEGAKEDDSPHRGGDVKYPFNLDLPENVPHRVKDSWDHRNDDHVEVASEDSDTDKEYTKELGDTLKTARNLQKKKEAKKEAKEGGKKKASIERGTTTKSFATEYKSVRSTATSDFPSYASKDSSSTLPNEASFVSQASRAGSQSLPLQTHHEEHHDHHDDEYHKISQQATERRKELEDLHFDARPVHITKKGVPGRDKVERNPKVNEFYETITEKSLNYGEHPSGGHGGHHEKHGAESGDKPVFREDEKKVDTVEAVKQAVATYYFYKEEAGVDDAGEISAFRKAKETLSDDVGPQSQHQHDEHHHHDLTSPSGRGSTVSMTA